MKITRNTVWRTQFGERIKIKDLDDVHLVNMRYALLNGLYTYKAKNYLKVINVEVKRRGIELRFIARAPIPFVGPKGKWMVWEPKLGLSVVCSDRKAKLVKKSRIILS